MTMTVRYVIISVVWQMRYLTRTLWLCNTLLHSNNQSCMLSLYRYRVISIASNEMVGTQSLVVQARELIEMTTVIHCWIHPYTSILSMVNLYATYPGGLLITRPISKVHILSLTIVTL